MALPMNFNAEPRQVSRQGRNSRLLGPARYQPSTIHHQRLSKNALLRSLNYPSPAEFTLDGPRIISGPTPKAQALGPETFRNPHSAIRNAETFRSSVPKI